MNKQPDEFDRRIRSEISARKILTFLTRRRRESMRIAIGTFIAWETAIIAQWNWRISVIDSCVHAQCKHVCWSQVHFTTWMVCLDVALTNLLDDCLLIDYTRLAFRRPMSREEGKVKRRWRTGVKVDFRWHCFSRRRACALKSNLNFNFCLIRHSSWNSYEWVAGV